MSNLKKNNNPEPLKSFLNSSENSSAAPMDDFDKEALDGFAVLENETEILDLKERLDARAYAEVFNKEKKSQKVYWYAAAGLFLLIGFSTYFLITTTVSENKDLAVEPTHLKSDGIQQTLTEGKKSNDVSGNVAETLTLEKPTSINSEKEEENLIPVAPKKGTPTTEPENKAADQTALTAADSESPAVAAEPPLASTDKKESASTPVFAAPQQESDNLSFSEDLNAYKNINVEEVQVVSRNDSKKKKSVNKKNSRSSEKSDAAGAGSSPPDIKDSQNCYYQGGEQALSNELRQKLKEKNLLQKFDAVLYVSATGKVENVSYTTAYGLTKEQQISVTEVLKQLNAFHFANPVSGKSLSNYTLIFRP